MAEVVVAKNGLEDFDNCERRKTDDQSHSEVGGEVGAKKGKKV